MRRKGRTGKGRVEVTKVTNSRVETKRDLTLRAQITQLWDFGFRVSGLGFGVWVRVRVRVRVWVPGGGK